MTYSAKTWPSTFPRMRAKAIRLRLKALRISSTDISTITALRRARTPNTPMENSTAPSTRKLAASTMSVLARQDDGADGGGEEDERDGQERDEVVRQDVVGDVHRRGRAGVRQRVAAGEVDGGPRQHPEQEEGDGHRPAPPPVHQAALAPDLGPGEHDAEQEQDHHGADVD